MGDYGWYGVDNAPIEIKVKVGHDGHYWYEPGVVAKTRLEDATFSGTIKELCDSPNYGDHSALFSAYLAGGKKEFHTVVTVYGSKYPGEDTGYALPAEMTAVPFTVDECHALPTHTKTNQHLVTSTVSSGTRH
jgi:hypothetical protein